MFTSKLILDPFLLPNAAPGTAQYTCPAKQKTLIKKATITNTSTTIAYVATVHTVTAAGTVSALNMILNARAIAPKETYEATELENHLLNAGDMIFAFADTAAVLSMRVSGIVITE
jgi:hypothetical protein